MTRYIDTDMLRKNEIARCHCVPCVGSRDSNYKNLDEVLNDTPTSDVEEVRHGKWIPSKVEAIKTTFICSECNREVDMTNDYFGKPSIHVGKHYPYCHCGARMDREGVRNEQRTAD